MIETSPIVTASVAKQIAESLRAAIMDGRLKLDQRLPSEDDLARRYGVSRPTIREALKRLAAQNLIRSRRGPTGGNFVNRPTPEDLGQMVGAAATLMISLGTVDVQDITAARLHLEGVCCELAAANRNRDHLARLAAELAVQGAAQTTDEEFCASDVRFHRTIVDAAGNPVIAMLMHGVIEAMVPVTNMVVNRVRQRADIVALHRALADAIGGGDAVAARAALSTLIDYLRDSAHEAQDRRKQ